MHAANTTSSHLTHPSAHVGGLWVRLFLYAQECMAVAQRMPPHLRENRRLLAERSFSCSSKKIRSSRPR